MVLTIKTNFPSKNLDSLLIYYELLNLLLLSPYPLQNLDNFLVGWNSLLTNA